MNYLTTIDYSSINNMKKHLKATNICRVNDKIRYRKHN